MAATGVHTYIICSPILSAYSIGQSGGQFLGLVISEAAIISLPGKPSPLNSNVHQYSTGILAFRRFYSEQKIQCRKISSDNSVRTICTASLRAICGYSGGISA